MQNEKALIKVSATIPFSVTQPLFNEKLSLKFVLQESFSLESLHLGSLTLSTQSFYEKRLSMFEYFIPSDKMSKK